MTRHVDFLLVGGGPDRARLAEIAAARGVETCFYGPCYDEATLAGLLHASAVTVAPGKAGLTAMHSLVYGTPVITHDDAGLQMPEWEAVVPGYNGALFKRNDPGDLSTQIREWTRAADVDDRQRLRCYEVVDRYYTPTNQRLAIDRAVSGYPAKAFIDLTRVFSGPGEEA